VLSLNDLVTKVPYSNSYLNALAQLSTIPNKKYVILSKTLLN